MKKTVLPDIVSLGLYNAQLAQKNRAVTQNRMTTMFELELPLEDGGISYIDDSSHAISVNTVICAKPGQLRHTRLPFKCHYVHMVVTEGRMLDILSSLPNFIDLTDASEIRALLTEMCDCHDIGTPDDDVILYSLLLKLVHILNKQAIAYRIDHSPKANNHEVIERTLEYVNANLTSDLSLERLSNMAKFSPIYFHKLFKASTGKTLHEYITDQRIKKAVTLLVSTDMTLTQVAYESGFSSQSYFSYAFKKKKQLSPREYAKRLVNNYK